MLDEERKPQEESKFARARTTMMIKPKAKNSATALDDLSAYRRQASMAP